MPDDTTILSLPLILPAQAQKHVTHNEALVKLDLMVQLAVINRTLTTPPALPTVGDRHIVATGATGPWVGQAGRIAMFTEAGWQFTQALPGWQAYVMAESQMAFFNGLTWIALSDGPFTVGQLGVSATPDATNRLAVSSPATLLNHAGAGHQLKLNKAAAADTASLLFQTGFSGRAEMGTAGANDFQIKVSADGSAWFTAFEADAATGEVVFPQPVHLGGQAADPGAPADGTLWLNTTTGEVKVHSAGVTQVIGGGAGGVSDGDKGDITVSGGGTSWTIDAGSVSLGKLADLATSTILGRTSVGTGVPEALTATQVRTMLNVADGATANATDADLRDRATHTGTQSAATITGLAGVATSGSASDLTAGTLPAARFDDTAHGPRAGGALHDAATGSVAGFMSAADKVKLDGVAAGANAYSHPNHSGDVTSVGDGATTIASGAVTNAKMANMAANTVKANATGTAAAPADLAVGTNTVLGRVAGNIVAAQLVAAQVTDGTLTNAKLATVATATLKGRATAGAGAPEDLTAAQATSILDLFTSGAKGLAPASGGGTTNFLRADGAWAAPSGGGGGSPGGTTGQIQFNDAGSFAGAADVEVEDGQLRLPAIAIPPVPSAGGIKLFGRNVGGRIMPAFIGPSGLDTSLQPLLAGNSVFMVSPSSGTTAPNVIGGTLTTAATMSLQQTFGSTNRWLATARKRFQTSTTAGNASGMRTNYRQWFRGSAPGFGGFFFRAQFGQSINLNGAQCFIGLADNTNALSGDVSTVFNLNMCGMGYDAGDPATGNWQFFRNDGAGSPVKVDLGSDGARDVNVGYDLSMFLAPGGSELFVRIINLNTGAEVLSTSYTTDIPAVNTGMCFHADIRNGAVAAATNIEVAKAYVETDY